MVTLDGSPLFCQLSPEELSAVRWVAQERQYKAGQQIFKEGDPGDGLYVVKEGVVEISATVGPNVRRVFSRLNPGDFFGEMAVLDYKQRSAYAAAATDTTAYFIPRLEILKLIERSPVLAMSLMREISTRLREFSKQYVREVMEAERLALVGHFARGILHDIKNPLNIIGLAAELFPVKAGHTEHTTRAAVLIRKQVEHITDLVTDVLEFTKGKPGEMELAPADYGAFVRQLVQELRPELALKKTTIALEEPVPNCVVMLHPKRLARVFYNLAQNASDAMDDNGHVTLRIRLSGQEAVTELSDNGPGLPPELAGRLFEPFATHGKVKGTGLGLSICKRIVEDHGGWLTAENHPAGGAVFTMGLPVASAPGGYSDRA